ncbi:LacI family DNA-binding transcriptional regulator [Roseiterribacter gracilis]|uniref:LacI family transcriptional regulator n=1 Tax=Roseiterribacter gracilis TaxID=2812848 RepID=A0A8S8XB14_9PROT|nr:LacI family transcriptional regulator [Rhodospirillales bacterium TMPK1]
MQRQRRRNSSAVTIREVAELAKVSAMTVSRVINNETNVNENTRALVQAAIQQLNYSPNPAARSLAGSEIFRIGLLYSNPSVAYLSEFLVGALDESSKTGHQIVVERTAPNGERAAISKMLKGGISGIILPPPLCESKTVLDAVREANLPAVCAAPGEESTDMASVRIDNYRAARDIAEYLLSVGHRQFGFIKGHPNQTVSSMRLKGLQDALQAAKLDPSAIQLEQGYFDYQSGLAAAEHLLTASTRPTAIFAANDDMAAATLSVAHRLGLTVPGDVSIAGFDDTLLATNIWPALTTVRQPIADMGRASVDLLLEEIQRRRSEKKTAPRQLLLPYTLVQRESTAAPHRTGGQASPRPKRKQA